MIDRLLAAERRLADGSPEALAVAERLYRTVAEADPRNAIAVVGLAKVARARGEPDAARDLAGRALAIDPDDHAARRLLADLDAAAPTTAVAVEAPTTEVPPVVEAARRRGWLGRLLDRLFGRSRPVS